MPVVVNEGEQTELVCKAHGKQIPEIKWFKGDELIEASDMIKIQGSADPDSFESESHLLFENVALGDEHEHYRMVASNVVGSVSHDLGLIGTV